MHGSHISYFGYDGLRMKASDSATYPSEIAHFDQDCISGIFQQYINVYYIILRFIDNFQQNDISVYKNILNEWSNTSLFHKSVINFHKCSRSRSADAF